MASEFLQMVVVVELRNPPERLHGFVTGVEAGQSLTLSNVWSLDHHAWHPQVVVDPANIAEISDGTRYSELSLLPPPPVPTQLNATAPTQIHVPRSDIEAAAPVLGDPAVISFRARVDRPGSDVGLKRSESQSQIAAITTESTLSAADLSSDIRIQKSSRDVTPIYTAPAREKRPQKLEEVPVVMNATSTSRTRAARCEAAGTTTAVRSIFSKEGSSKARRRQQSHRGAGNDLGNKIGDTAPEEPKNTEKGEGWRKTPLLQSTASFQPFSSLKISAQRSRTKTEDNGWATEDVTDVQEMGDFDFEESLAKFDKQTLFDQMRRDDQTDDAVRLVSHNRNPAPKPGTAGGKNYHHTENILDTPIPLNATTTKTFSKESQIAVPDIWNSEADSTRVTGMVGSVAGGAGSGGDRLSAKELGSRQGSRRGDKKMPSRQRSQSQKTSARSVSQGLLRDSSVTIPSAVSTTQHFCLLPSRRRLETVSALQMLNLENIAHNELGLTEDMITENAGRGIAEVAFRTLSDPANRIRLGRPDMHGSAHSAVQINAPAPTIVILAGNNKSGSRAVAAGRHLRNKGVNVVMCVVGIERGERELLEDLRQQVRLYQNFGGCLYSKSDLFEYMRKTAIPTLAIDTARSAAAAMSPAVALIIDALLGLVVSFDDLRTGDQATVYELMEWANRNEAFVLAVDVPTGVDPSSGCVSVIDGARLYVRPRYVVALGAPKRGLLEAIAAAEIGDLAAGEAAMTNEPALDWVLFLADIGLGAAVWKKAGTKIRRGIDFDYNWVLEMKFQGLKADKRSG
ncbi:enhancer of mRNA decapping [Sporothrix epigloea]|uniref:Enhancer of mRNA-decapping protein 3 n=1 Tax=Sporothrix epigloea TaxID=1892477 RepID=A0ABP0DWM0_9PEZI